MEHHAVSSRKFHCRLRESAIGDDHSLLTAIHSLRGDHLLYRFNPPGFVCRFAWTSVFTPSFMRMSSA